MASPTPSSENGKTDQSFSLSLTIYSHVKKGKGKTKEEKTTKMKELVFGVCTSTANYLSFLRNVLLKHNLRDSNISRACNYPFKYLLPKQRISDAIDVDDAADYNEMVKKIIEGIGRGVVGFVEPEYVVNECFLDPKEMADVLDRKAFLIQDWYASLQVVRDSTRWHGGRCGDGLGLGLFTLILGSS
ncbi:hypothetical protein EV363DRAFT_1347777 [Boletus edulis]|nr:hypothetical protein EV363DRAFT_1347777 [Boletus edulis]